MHVYPHALYNGIKLNFTWYWKHANWKFGECDRCTFGSVRYAIKPSTNSLHLKCDKCSHISRFILKIRTQITFDKFHEIPKSASHSTHFLVPRAFGSIMYNRAKFNSCTNFIVFFFGLTENTDWKFDIHSAHNSIESILIRKKLKIYT